ncbi:hypothetical protein ABZP36_027592 [Zizania latifolia]
MPTLPNSTATAPIRVPSFKLESLAAAAAAASAVVDLSAFCRAPSRMFSAVPFPSLGESAWEISYRCYPSGMEFYSCNLSEGLQCSGSTKDDATAD